MKTASHEAKKRWKCNLKVIKWKFEQATFRCAAKWNGGSEPQPPETVRVRTNSHGNAVSLTEIAKKSRSFPDLKRSIRRNFFKMGGGSALVLPAALYY